jgi:hypothetical protein
MLLFGSIAPGGGSGAQLWQLNGAAPADIELNPGAGALGIYAELTTNPLFKLILANLGGQDTFAAGYIDFINNIYTVVSMRNGEGGMQHSNNTTGVNLSVDFDANITNPDILINASVGNNSTEQQFRSDYIKQSIVVGGIDAMFTKLTNRHFSIQNQFGNTTFQISRNGAIDTNQTVASITPRIKTAEMPIHDISGAIVGYIDIKN